MGSSSRRPERFRRSERSPLDQREINNQKSRGYHGNSVNDNGDHRDNGERHSKEGIRNNRNTSHQYEPAMISSKFIVNNAELMKMIILY